MNFWIDPRLSPDRSSRKPPLFSADFGAKRRVLGPISSDDFIILKQFVEFVSGSVLFLNNILILESK